MPTPRTTSDLTTPALVVDVDAFDYNIATMSAALPGARLRPHVKAHKSTALAARQRAAGHTNFTCATVREIEGMAAAGLGDDLLLANEVADATRLGKVAASGTRVTVAVDSSATVAAAAAGGVRECVIDVNVGLPRCGIAPDKAGALADEARAAGIEVRGVMGYEGHVVGNPDREARVAQTEQAMQLLLAAHEAVGGDLISAGGTGTYDINSWANEIQAGSYALMDTAYGKLELPFRQALFVLSTVISLGDGFAVCDAGLKSLGMDHGNPSLAADVGDVWFCSDEHITFGPATKPDVGDRIRVVPAHVDPTVAYHEIMWVVNGDEIVDQFPVDLRGW
ncbi:MAG TPA: alanine racemase [Acidimicrobiales bacterium]|nr:alanine racemase [Acidimicrobiales bacterium]